MTAEQPTAVLDTSTLINLATPVVDTNIHLGPTQDPLKVTLTAYDVQVPEEVMSELTELSMGEDVLGTAATAVLRASDVLTTHDVQELTQDAWPPQYGLDRGEECAILLANTIRPAVFVTDEFGSSNFALVNLALDDSIPLTTTPELLVRHGMADNLDAALVDRLLTNLARTKSWDPEYIDHVRTTLRE